MSKETLPNPQQNEEVDLGQLFAAIGNLFNKFFSAILSVLKFFLNIIVYCSRALVNNFKLVAVVLIVSAIAGYFLEKIKAPTYESSMLVRTYFDSKYQLNKNLNYYNALISNEDYSELSSIFEIDESTIKNIIELELLRGDESENEQFVQYDNFLKSLDSVRAQEISFDDYLENRDELSGNLFEINVKSRQKDIFRNLEKGINKSFENLYSVKKKQIRDSMLTIRKETILNSISEIDSLQNVYITVLEEESQATNAKINFGEGFPLQQEKSETKEYQLLNKEIELRNELRMIEEESVEENEFFEVITDFQNVGEEVSNISEKYTLLLPALAFGLLCLGFLIKNYLEFLKTYEG